MGPRVLKSLTLLAALLGVFAFTVNSCAQEDLPSSKVHGYLDIFQVIEKHSFYKLEKEELIKMHECILSKAFGSLEIERGNTLKHGINIPSCFKQDQHAAYFTPAELKEIKIRQAGRFSGVGITIRQTEDKAAMVVEEILPTGPAARDGRIKKGDLIIAVGEDENSLKIISGLPQIEILNLIRGPKSTRVFLKIKRVEETHLFQIERDEVKIVNVESHEIEGGIGYLKIKSFESARLITEEVDPVLIKFKNKGVRALVLDLRNNPGGTLLSAKEFLERFSHVPMAHIVELRGRNGKAEEDDIIVTSGRGEYADWKVIILVNENSASASEIVAGVLQLWGHKVAGKKTYGKGSVQIQMTISGGGAFQLTTAKYYFANNKTPDGEGITPDLTIDEKENQLKSAVDHLKKSYNP